MSEPPRPSFYPLMPRLLCRADESERVKRSREAKQRISDPEGIGEVLLRRADREVRRYVSLQLRPPSAAIEANVISSRSLIEMFSRV